jgi:hypothetical protein
VIKWVVLEVELPPLPNHACGIDCICWSGYVAGKENFELLVNKKDSGQCWNWLGAKTSRGDYGIYWWEGRTHVAHRIAYFLEHGEWPIPHCLHICDNGLCCNPKHLYAGTQADNNRDRDERGRGARGERSGASKLTTEQILAIRSDSRTTRVIADEYGIDYGHVGRIKRYEKWAHIAPALVEK